ncbi:MAG: chaperonin GroEL [Chlamydiales bacterium]
MTVAKELLFEENARSKLKVGVRKLRDVVAPTLGPKGRSVGLDLSWGAPKITKDGGSIVNDIEDRDQYCNMGISMGKEVAQKVKERCGDGTTTGILLLDCLVSQGVKQIAAGHSPILLMRGMEKALRVVLEKISESATKVQEQVESIATVSASGDREIGELIAKAFTKAGSSGVITIEEGRALESEIKSVEGMEIPRGYLSRHFCTDESQAVLESPKVLITDKKISSVQEILPILQAISGTGFPLLIIAEDIEGDALSTLVINRLRGSLRVVAIKAPGFGDDRKAQLEDLAALTGAVCVSEDKGLLLKNADVDVLGTAGRIEVGKDHTLILNGGGNIVERTTQIENELSSCDSQYEKEKLEKRKAKLLGGVVVIEVSAPTEVEMNEKKQRFQDSLNATRAAMEEGVVAGGGIALIRAADAIKNLELSAEEKVGANILAKACEAPFCQIVENAGFESAPLLMEAKNGNGAFGFNAKSEKMEDLLQAGVIDPAKVVKESLKSSVSVAGVIWRSEALIGNCE